MAFKQKVINFEISLTKLKYVPKHLTEIPKIISRAFEREITMKEIQPIIGSDHVKEWVLREDADIPEFYNAPNMMQEWIAEKLIKVKIPDGIIPKDFQPKRVKILATGKKLAKFFGEDSCSTRTVESTLKIFDCNHFYLKQTLPGSGASPHWTIYEGRWHATERGLRLEYLIRYSWQLSRKPAIDFSVEATKSELQTSLAWDGETEKQLNGNIPAIVGTDDFFWVELVREGDAGEAKIRWNEDCPEPPSWKRREKPERSSVAADARAEGPESQRKRPAEGQTSVPAAATPPRSSYPAAAPAAVAPPSASPPKVAPGAPMVTKSERKAEQPVAIAPDDQSPWPLYVGFSFYVVLASFFLYLYWNELN
mmetsp:Transcript_91284/g.263409  ORF Transcript_91284/g.263409 Transcript_91284/m.263409 type:complete len:366 (+) Transcript_91284:90-1187(+)